MIPDQQEIWKKVEGVDHDVWVSNFGRIKNMTGFKHGAHKPGRFVAQVDHTSGYLTASLVVNRNRKTFLIHRIVAIHFIPNPNNYLDVNHKDCNKKNNMVDNLEWCTRKQNMEHASMMNILEYGEKRYNSKLTNAMALEALELSKIFTQKEIAERMKVSRTAITNLLLGKSWSKITGLTNPKSLKTA